MSAKKTGANSERAGNDLDKDEEPEHKTQSLLDVCLEREKLLQQRLYLVARLPKGGQDRTELAAHYEKLSLQLSKRFPLDNMTGILLLYTTCLIHVIESSRDVLFTILEDLIELQEQTDCVLLEAPKIVFMAHSPRSRQFQQWSYKLLNTDTDQAAASREPDPTETETLILEIVSSVTTVAKQLEQAKRTEGGSAVKMQGLSPDGLITLTYREDLFTPQQYLNMYQSPLHVNLEISSLTFTGARLHLSGCNVKKLRKKGLQ